MSNQETQNNVVEDEPLSWKFWRKRRYVVVFLSFLGFFNVYSLRVNLSVAIVAMTENRTMFNETSGTYDTVQDFPWDSKEKGLILSSFFYGYILTQLLGGFIGAKIGGNIVSWIFFCCKFYKILKKTLPKAQQLKMATHTLSLVNK